MAFMHKLSPESNDTLLAHLADISSLAGKIPFVVRTYRKVRDPRTNNDTLKLGVDNGPLKSSNTLSSSHRTFTSYLQLSLQDEADSLRLDDPMWQKVLITVTIWAAWKILPTPVKGFVKKVATDGIWFLRDHAVADINTLFICNAPKSFLITDTIYRRPTIRSILKAIIYTVTLMIYSIPILILVYLERPSPASRIPDSSPQDGTNPAKIRCSGLRTDLERCGHEIKPTAGMEEEWYCINHRLQGIFAARRHE